MTATDWPRSFENDVEITPEMLLAHHHRRLQVAAGNERYPIDRRGLSPAESYEVDHPGLEMTQEQAHAFNAIHETVTWVAEARSLFEELRKGPKPAYEDAAYMHASEAARAFKELAYSFASGLWKVVP